MAPFTSESLFFITDLDGYFFFNDLNDLQGKGSYVAREETDDDNKYYAKVEFFSGIGSTPIAAVRYPAS